MSEKRFSIKYNTTSTNYPSGRAFDNEKQHTLYIDEVVNLLNWLSNENKELKEENEQLKQQLNKIFVLIDIKQNSSKENMEEWAFKDVPASTSREYYYSGMLDACMQLRDEILNGDLE